MQTRYQLGHLSRAPEPDPTEAWSDVPASTLVATLALFDAIELDHEVLMGFALAQGARLDLFVQAEIGKPAHSALHRAALRATWEPETPGGGGCRRRPDDPRSLLVDRLVAAGARDVAALQAFNKDWLFNDNGHPRHDPMVLQVEQAGLDAVMQASPGDPVFRFVDASGQELGVKTRVFAKPQESWLSVAARHRRADVVERWFAQGGVLNDDGLRGFLSPLVAAFEPSTSLRPVRAQDEESVRRTLLTAWQQAPDALYRQEALHLAIAQAQWSSPTPKGPEGAQRAGELHRVLFDALERRPIDLHLTHEEGEMVKTVVFQGEVVRVLGDLETAVLRHSLRDVPSGPSLPRARL